MMIKVFDFTFSNETETTVTLVSYIFQTIWKQRQFHPVVDLPQIHQQHSVGNPES